jgi:hypothetical protein
MFGTKPERNKKIRSIKMVSIAQTDYLENIGNYVDTRDGRHSSVNSNNQDNYFTSLRSEKNEVKEIEINDLKILENASTKTMIYLFAFSIIWSSIPAILNLIFPKFLGVSGYIFSGGLIITFIVKALTSK